LDGTGTSGNRNTDAGPADEAERALLDGLCAGEEAAFTDLVTRYGGPMLAVARRILGNEEDARDCVQDALISAAGKIEKFEGRSKLSTWLHRIVVNSALSQLRRRARRPEQSIEPLIPNFDMMGCRIELPEDDYLSLEEVIDKTKVGTVVRDAIEQLPESYRIVLLLRDIEEFSVRETAELLETSEGAIKTRLHRARSALKVLLEPILARKEEQ
tara:strand:+ start:69282 stop:69923 length:642 start_codon:yes stop_codon:yes gene_type:complete